MYNGLASSKWLKGDLHVHTTASDGRMSRREALEVLRRHRFDFCAISDHDVYDAGGRDSGLLVLPSRELSSQRGHIVALFANGSLERCPDWSSQGEIDAVRAAGGLPILAHPRIKEFTSTQSMAFTCERLLCELSHFHGQEVYTHNVGSGFATAVDRLDAVWTGRIDAGSDDLPVWGYASSDAHAPEQVQDNVGILVAADECTPVAIRAALEAGRFYSLAATAARFEDICFDGRSLNVRATDAVMLRVKCTGGTPAEGRGHRMQAALKYAREAGTIELDYRVQGNEGYLRVEAMDSNGGFVYANPIRVCPSEGRSAGVADNAC